MKELKSWECEKCRRVYIDKEVASKCCADRFCGCGKKIEYTAYTKCQPCIEKNLYKKAEKIQYKDYDIEMFYDEVSDQFFREREEMIEYYENNNDEEIPDYAYGCSVVDFKIHGHDVLDNAMEDMHEEFDYNDVVNYQEFLDFIKEWNEIQTGKTYWRDYKKIIKFK